MANTLIKVGSFLTKYVTIPILLIFIIIILYNKLSN